MRGSILIADADRAGRGAVSAVLKRAAFETIEVDDGLAAIDAVRAGGIALVVLEVVLPEMSGYEVLRVVRTEYGDALPVVFLSRLRTDPLDRIAGLLLGADDFMTAPFDPDELVARVERFVMR